jgi:aryl-alcohol dehydrogenase-like predicted oxidoreductase
MQYRTLPSTDIQVSSVAFGAWSIVGGFNWGHQEESDSIAAIKTAREEGITLFDTAEMYGDGLSEELLQKALGKDPKAVIASKFGPKNARPEAIRASCEASLKRLDRDYIDLYQIHWPSYEIPLADQLGAMEMLREEGKIRAIGVCNFGPKDMADILAAGAIATNQMAYNLLWRAVEFDILPACSAANIGMLAYSPIMQGLLAGKFASADNLPEDRQRTRHFSCDRPLARHSEPGCEELTFATIDRFRTISERVGEPMADIALAWLLAQPGVTSVLAGARNPEQVRMNAKAGDLVLPDDILAELTDTTDELKTALGPNPDMWMSESRIR